ncbi:alanine racemase [Homoserinibacter sp. GY 40078]|uniref:alanine racemase n=1 Tax=Homoserinibacter sp. GY 40078 TaxID=2603275 RepID=UPI0011C9F9CF|nr:alanine racemase [Homoserinibacter sp. GY 40078]TXK17481.1 alanine racemase [Homoserinibacter sp. GY 40078]
MTSRIVVHLDAIRENVSALAALAAPARTMFAVKADAYGHGLLPVARAGLDAGADSLAVLDVPAALAVRDAGIEVPLFAWLHGADTEFRPAIDSRVDLGVSSLRELERIATAGAERAAEVHLKIDTGLHRNGADPKDWPALVGAALDLERHGRVRIAGIWSHLADASPADDRAALDRFRAAVDIAGEMGVPLEGERRPVLHLAASSAGIRFPEARLDLVRFGIAAYGVSPFDDVDAPGLGMRGTLSMFADVIGVDGDVAVLEVGSADGIPPSVLGASGRGAEILLAGSRAAVLEVGLDTLRVRIPEGTTVALGDEAVVYGPHAGAPSVEDWAHWAATIGDEILARSSRRLPRHYTG